MDSVQRKIGQWSKWMGTKDSAAFHSTNSPTNQTKHKNLSYNQSLAPQSSKTSNLKSWPINSYSNTIQMTLEMKRISLKLKKKESYTNITSKDISTENSDKQSPCFENRRLTQTRQFRKLSGDWVEDYRLLQVQQKHLGRSGHNRTCMMKERLSWT